MIHIDISSIECKDWSDVSCMNKLCSDSCMTDVCDIYCVKCCSNIHVWDIENQKCVYEEKNAFESEKTSSKVSTIIVDVLKSFEVILPPKYF